MRYEYLLPVRNDAQLDGEIRAAALPGYVTLLGSGDQVFCDFSAELTPEDRATLDGLIADHLPDPAYADGRRRDQALVIYDDPDSPGSLVELSGEYALLELINELQRLAGMGETGRAQLRNAVRAIIKPGGGV